MSDSLQPCGPPGPTRLLCLWDFPGKSIGVGCHSLFQGIFLTQRSNPRLCASCIVTWVIYHWATREALWLSYCFKRMKSHKNIPKHNRTYRINPWAFLQKPAWLWNLGNRQGKGQRCTVTSLKSRTKLKYLCIFNSCEYGTEGKWYTSDDVKITTKQFKSGPATTAHRVH